MRDINLVCNRSWSHFFRGQISIKGGVGRSLVNWCMDKTPVVALTPCLQQTESSLLLLLSFMDSA